MSVSTSEPKRGVSVRVAVVGGCGHVGLPLAIALANAGANVAAIDKNDGAINRVNAGEMPFMEVGGPDQLAQALKSGRFEATSALDPISHSDAVIVVIGTPVDEHLNPDPDAILQSLDEFAHLLRPNQLLILRSTVFPGVTKRIEQWAHARQLDLDVSFCPERIAEGHAFEELASLPQLIGTRSDSAWQKSRDLFALLTGSSIRLEPEEAELVKLFTNSWRYLKFAAANQFFVMANDLGVDYQKVHRAMTQDYPRASDVPGPGFAAGPCLLKDTLQLDALTGGSFFLGQAAMKINESLPDYLVRNASTQYPLAQMTVGILGMSFKAEIDDARDSLSYKLRKLLKFKSRLVLATDPFVVDERLVPLEKVLHESDLIFIGAPHRAYKQIKFRQPVIDIWGLVGEASG